MDLGRGFKIGEFEVQPDDNVIRSPTGDIRIEPKSMDVFKTLAEADGRTVSRQELLDAVWPRAYVTEDVLTRCVSQIRKALGDSTKSPRYVVTIPKRGYKVAMPVIELEQEILKSVGADFSAPVLTFPNRSSRPADPAIAGQIPGSMGEEQKSEKVDFKRILTRSLSFSIIALLAAVLGYFLWESRFRPTAAVPGDQVAIAVMPFKDLSPDGNQAWFALGVTEELMNALVQISDLDIVGRLTISAFDPARQSLSEFATKVGFTHVLDGSIRTAGSSVRVSAQLVRMIDGITAWSEVYDEELADVFSIQDRITAAIIDALKAHLVTDARPSSLLEPEQETDFDAYRLYLQGRYHLSLRTAENLEQSIRYFESSLQVDSKRSRTHSALASVYAFMPYYSAARSSAETRLLARQHAELALLADANNAEAHSVIGILSMTQSRDWNAAAEAFERAMDLAPGSADIANLSGDFFYTIGDYDSALEMESTAARLDSLSAVNHLELGLVHAFRGEYEQAIRQSEIAIELNHELPNAWWQLFRSNFLAGNIDSARQLIRDNAARLGQGFLAEARVMLAVHDGNYAEAHQVASSLDTVSGESDASLTKRALLFAMAGDGESAASYIERAYTSGDPILISPMHFFLPEDWEALPEVVSALDKPGFRQLFELRRGFIARGSGRRNPLLRSRSGISLEQLH